MQKHNCIMIKAKNLCPYNQPENILRSEYCCRCTLPDVYSGKRKVPDSHCEAGNRIFADSPAVAIAKARKWDADRMYDYLMQISTVFQNLGMDQRAQMLIDMKIALDKHQKF